MGRDLIIKSLYLEEEAKKRELEESNKVQALSFSKTHSRAQSSISTSLESSNIIKKLKLEELYSYTSSTGFDNNLDLLLKEFLDNS
jgi:superfamily II DNA helicase RecQ